MSRLGKRLQRTLKGRRETFEEPNRLAASLAGNDRLRKRLEECMSTDKDPIEFLALPGAKISPTTLGQSYHIDTRFPLDTLHGDLPLGAFFKLDPVHMERVVGDERLGGFSPKETLFLDIEATGLDHGAGTYAFMIGLGFLRDDAVHVKQLFLPSVGDEPALLEELRELLSQFKYLISFNGKSYDLTVLQSRMIFQRVYTEAECNLKLQPHLDLLHLARNMYRNRVPDTRLPTLETEVLGFQRVDDIPGSLVPACWYQFLRANDARAVVGVFEHNLHDVLSMITLAYRLTTDSDLTSASCRQQPLLRFNLGRVLFRRRFFEECVEALSGVDFGALGPLDGMEGHHLLARAHARLGDTCAQGRTLNAWVVAFESSERAWTALAIFRERQEKNLLAALYCAQRALLLHEDQGTRRRVARLVRRTEEAS